MFKHPGRPARSQVPHRGALFGPRRPCSAWAGDARLSLATIIALVDLMIEHGACVGVGVEPIKVAAIHRINEDCFDEL